MRVRLKQRSPSVDTAEHPILLIPVSLYRVMDQHKLSREQWEERIQVWHAEHSGMLKWVVCVGPWAGQLAACLVTLSLYFYDMVLLVRGLGFELPVWAYSWCAFFSSVLNHMVKYSSIVCTGAENSVALWRSWACVCLISDSFEWEKSKGVCQTLQSLKHLHWQMGKAQILCLSYSLYPETRMNAERGECCWFSAWKY